LAGESGSGKTTLGYAITRLLRPPAVITGGTVLYHPADGREPIDILHLSPARLRAFRWNKLAIVFQSAMNALNPVLSLGTQLEDVLRFHWPEMSREQHRARALELLKLVGIAPDCIRSYPHELSGGMRQRAIIAMALALSPEVVIMDEPTTALDVVVQREILLKMMGLRDDFGFSVIFITHDLSLLLELADSIAIMYAGRVVETATCRALQRQPRHPYSYGMLHSFPSLHGPRRRMTGIPGSPPDLRAVSAGCAFQPRCTFALPACSGLLPTLTPPAAELPDQLVACHLYDPMSHPQMCPPMRILRRATRRRIRPDGAEGGAMDEEDRAMNLDYSAADSSAAPAHVMGQRADALSGLPIQPPVLEARQVRKYFPLRQVRLFGASRVVHAVEDASLMLHAGRALALVGESGSGKSTIAHLLARLYEPTAGEITFREELVKAGRAALRAYRRQVQMVFQDPFSSLNPVHSVRYVLSRPLRLHKLVRSKQEETEQILALLDRVSLSPAEQFIQKYPHQLSGGQRQRVGRMAASGTAAAGRMRCRGPRT
jgi:peptide/nickel transport system ATP-binding protein